MEVLTIVTECKKNSSPGVSAAYHCLALLCADAWGTAGLLACLAAGSFYQQPPMRVRTGKADKEPPAGNAGPELTKPLLGKSPV